MPPPLRAGGMAAEWARRLPRGGPEFISTSGPKFIVTASRSLGTRLWVARRLCRILLRLVLGDALLQILQAELQLFVAQLLRATAELVARQAAEQKANFLVFRMQFTMLTQQDTQHLLQ